jgi:HEAT repeat protein
MIRVCVLVGSLLIVPLVAAAQAPPPPPVVPPASAVPAVPPLPPRPSGPAVVTPPAPRAPRLIEPVIVDIDPLTIDDAVRASLDAVRLVDTNTLVDQAFELTQQIDQVDVDGLKAQAKADAENAKAQAKELSKSSAEAAKAQAKAAAEVAKQSMDFDAIRRQADEMRDRMFELRDFNFDLQDRGPDFRFSSNGPGNSAYDRGWNAIQRRQYDQAVTLFDQAISQKSPRADGALYWKAFAQWRLGRRPEAQAAIAELRRSYPQSRYLNDARVLEAEVGKSSGQAISADANDDEIKLLAISGIQNSDPDRAIPLLDGVLKAANTPQVKRRALFVLAQNDRPAAHQILMSYAKGGGNPDLQIDAIRYLGDRKQQTTGTELQDIYNSTQDLDVRRAVLDAFVSSGNKAALVHVFTTDSSADLRRIALGNLGHGSLMTPQELFQLYQKEDNQDLRMTMVRQLGSMDAITELQQIIKTEKVPAVRQQAIRNLGNMKTDRTGQMLTDLYASEQDRDTRKAIISALGNQNNADGLIAIARKETGDLKVEIVRRIAEMAPKNKAAMDFLMEQVK